MMLSQSFYRPFISHFLPHCFQKFPDFISEREQLDNCPPIFQISPIEKLNQTTTGSACLDVFQGRQHYIH